MKSTVIDVAGLSKHFLLGELHKHQNSIRDAITKLFSPRIKANDKQRLWALKDVSFKVGQGEILGLIGNNGGGKSTLLKILSGITRPTSGKATVCGRIRTLLEVGTGFHLELTGKENIYLNGSVLGMKKTEINKKFDEIVDFSGVENFIDTPIKRYSSGMHLRLAFAVAAFLDAEILFADEILAVGDIEFQRKCLGKMSDVVKDGRTIIFVSHQLSAIRALCNRVIWLEQGRIMEAGDCPEVVNNYEKNQLRQVENFSSQISRQDKDKGFYIKNIHLMDEGGRPGNVFRYKESLTVILHISGPAPADSYSVEFNIAGAIDSIAQSHAILSMGASGRFHNKYFAKDTRKIRLHIGPLLLSGGNYSISFSLTAAGQVIDTWEQACLFKLTGCTPVAGYHHEISAAGCVLEHSFSPME